MHTFLTVLMNLVKQYIILFKNISIYSFIKHVKTKTLLNL